MKQTKLQKKIMQKYKIEDEQKIDKQKLEEISKKEKIFLKDLIVILGCYKGIIYKKEKSYTKIKISKKRTIREKIKIIKLELKYLKEYGERSYSKKEIEKICEIYEVKIEEFLTYIKGYKICYYENFEIISKNEIGIWIGNPPYVSSTFIAKNFEYINQEINRIAKKVANIYNIVPAEDLIDVAKNKILKMGDIEKNLSFDKNRMIRKILYKARFCMIDYAINAIKKFRSVEIDDIKYYEHYENNSTIQEWLHPIKFNFNQRIIIQEIIRNLYNENETRLKILKKIYNKLDMNKNEFYNELNNIQELLLKFKKIKICNNGRIIINE